ncbi:NADH-cytochrome b5 reductase 3 [Brevipalpus obovatus]|uniref:NADH-cytochrome b5 reductase 3 n=1 Tax=Brevipalpus obovatus TaxID=246614 RepID=UPI003D9DD101
MFKMKSELPSTLIIGSLVTIAIGALIGWLMKKNGKKSVKIMLEDPKAKYSVPLIEKEEISWNTKRYRFGLPSKEHALGLPTGQHIYVTATINNDLIIRPYTPISSDDDRGYFDLLIKVYFPNQHPKFPAGGKMSCYIDQLKMGDTIQVRGPNGHLTYDTQGHFKIAKNKKEGSKDFVYNKVGMIAGGTGITPMLQIIRAILKNPDDKTKVWLLFANQKEEEILLRKELDEVAASHPDQVKVWYTLDQGNPDWKFSTGFIDEQMVRDHLPPPSDDTVILMCGPPPMITYACMPNLDKAGHSPDQRFSF